MSEQLRPDAPETSYSTPLISLDAVALDTETTGLDARVARLVQVGGIRIRQGALETANRYETLVNPGGPIPKVATAIHGISDGMVSAAPKFGDIAPDLESFIGSSIVVGHTIYYDLAVIDREYDLAGKKGRPGWRGLDIRMLARLASPSLADYSLERLCDWLGIELKGRHTAMGDAEAAGRVFLALIPLLRDRNIRTLAEAQAASRTLAEDEARHGTAFLPERPRPPDQSSAVARIDSFPYRHRVRDVMSAPALFAEPDMTLRQVLQLLIEKRVSSVFIRAPSGETGIATERDILRALHEGGEQALAARVDSIMKSPLQTVAAETFLYRAIGRIDRLGFRHLGVTDARGNIVGAVTTRNLLRHRAAVAIMLGDEIEAADGEGALGAAFAKLPLMARKLMEEGVDPRMVSAVVSSEICSMTRRAAQLAEERLASAGATPPVAYAVMVLGSAGRGESQLAADQDNAIVYAEGKEGGSEDLYFEKLAREMNAILDAAGVPLCKGGVMARNREWRKSAADWRATIESWVRRQRPQDLLNVDIFFDAVPVHGEAALAEAVWEYAYECGHAARDFQNVLIETARQGSSALTMFGNFKLNERGRIDLKRHGLMPIFTAARVLSIRHDVRTRSSRERLEGAAAKGVGSPEMIQSINDAHRLILGAVIAQQLADGETGVPPTPHVAPERLDKAGKAELKNALLAVEEAVGLASEGRL